MKFATLTALVATVSAEVGDESNLYGLPVCVTDADCDDQIDNVTAIFDEISELTDEEKATGDGLKCGKPLVEDEPLMEEDICIPRQGCGEALNLEYEDAREIISFTCGEDAGSEGSATKLAVSVIATLAVAYAL